MSASTRVSKLMITCWLATIGGGCGGSPPDAEVVARADPGDASRGRSEPGVVVDVAGAVRRPGVYRLDPGARVHEAIEAAGGPLPRAVLDTLNRAAIVQDGQQVLVEDAAGSTAAPTGAGDASTGPVNLNQADVDALDELPGIGQVTAERIVASRDEQGPFASIDDLDRVSGIGPATIESLRDVATT
jgi:competence protein ComEA